MGVSTRHITIAGAALSSLLLIGGVAVAGGMGSGGGSAGPGVVIPGASVGGPTINTGGMGGMGTGSGCCGGKGGNVSVGVVVPGVNIAGPNVNVGGPTVSVGGSTLIDNRKTSVLDSGLIVNGGRTNDTFIGGGGSFYSPVGTAPSLVVFEGETETYTDTESEQVPVTEEICRDQVVESFSTVRPVQAVCIDDKGTPHPASRPDAAQRVSTTFGGEVFRCMSGTKMLVTIGTLNGNKASFDRAETIACKKGEALVHRPGGGLACAPQIPQRNCNERSLLRRNGPGIKLIEYRGQRQQCVPETVTRYETVQRQVTKTRQLPSTQMVFDGGVGNGVY